MANGENTAKETVLREVAKLQARLDTDGAGNPEVHGAALNLLISMVVPLFRADIQTLNGCQKMQSDCHGKSQFGWPLAFAIVSIAGMISGLVLKLMS